MPRMLRGMGLYADRYNCLDDAMITIKHNPVLAYSAALEHFLYTAEYLSERLNNSLPHGKELSVTSKDFIVKLSERLRHSDLSFKDCAGGITFNGTKSMLSSIIEISQEYNKHILFNGTRSFYRLLETDNPVVLPANTNIKLSVTAQDVIHS